MSESKKFTPEEKLLHIIEKPEEIDKLIEKKNSENKIISSIKNIIFPLSQIIRVRKITLQDTNKMLAVISVIMTILVIFSFIKTEKSTQERYKNLKRDTEQEAFQLYEGKKYIPDATTYLSATSKNNPFHVLPDVKKLTTEEKKEVKLKLVGIIWSDMPQAIIEDENTNKTYLVYKGDVIDKYNIKDITQNEVKLSSEDGEKTLR